jgi:hypothetical protein
MKTGKFKDMLLLTLQQTNELLSSLVVTIRDMENKPPPSTVITETEKYPEFLSVEMAMRYTVYRIFPVIHL